MKKLVLAVLVSFLAEVVLAQKPPDLENGFKQWGSYDGSHLDTVNLMNGGLMLHAPLLPNYPQRGGLNLQPILTFNSKTWQVICVDNNLNLPPCGWFHGGTGVTLNRPLDLGIQRTVQNQYNGVQNIYTPSGYSLTSADGAMHQLYKTSVINGVAVEFESLDNSGYHVVMSGSDPNGVPNIATITDRHGTQFVAVFGDSGVCGSIPYNAPLPYSGGGWAGGGAYAPMVDDSPFGSQYCPQLASSPQITDSNGNFMSASTLPGSDTLGRALPLGAASGTADYSGCNPNTNSAWLLSYSAPDGTTRQMKMCFAPVSMQTAFNQANVVEFPGGPLLPPGSNRLEPGNVLPPLGTVILADGTKWSFSYDSYGELSSVSLPTGGSISYTWTTIGLANGCSGQTQKSRAVATRTLNDGQGHSFTWTYTWGAPSSGVIDNVVTNPQGNDTEHIFTALDGPSGCFFYETSTLYYQGAKDPAHALRRVDTSYYPPLMTVSDSGEQIIGNVLAKDIVTTLYPGNKVSKVHREYDAGLGAGKPIFGNVKKEVQYDWGQGSPGAPLRETDTTYQWEINSAYLAAHLLDLPASVVVYDSGHNRVAETDYSYDEPAYLATPNPAVNTQHNPTPPNGVRGNQTTVSKWLNISNSLISSHTKWYDTGEPYQQIDALGHTTTLTYDLAYAGAYVTQTCSPQTGAVTHCVSGTYDFNTGVLTSYTNENATTQASGNTPGDDAHTTRFTYDKMFRIIQAQGPPDLDPANGGARAITNFTYSSDAAPFTYPFTVTRTRSVTNALTDSATNTFDGLGRLIKSQHVMPSGPPSTVDTTYDELGRVFSVSNPYFSQNEPTYGVTKTVYDALDRALLVQKADGSFSTTTYQDNCTVAEDEAGKARRTCTDALGRLYEVEEPGDTSAPAAGDTSTVSAQATAFVSVSGAEQSTTVSGDLYCALWDSFGGCADWEMGPPITTYDAGTVAVTVNGHATSVAYGGSDTAASVALHLANAINADSAAAVTASASGTQVTLTAKAGGQTGDYTASFSTTWDTSDFSRPSFSGMVSNLRLLGGADLNQFAHTYLTLYSYDALGNLLCVEQHGNVAPGTTGATGCAADPSLDAASPWRVRRFTYDSFSRLLTAKNPESGLISYGYDADSQLLMKTSQAPNQTGTATQTVSYCYDELHRVTGKAYGALACPLTSPVVSYAYDEGGSAANAKGKLTSLTDQAGTASYAYDLLGRMTGETRVIVGANNANISKSLSYTYNLDGSLKSLTYPSGATVTYTPDSAGRTLSAVDMGNSINYVTGATYGADGAITGFVSGQNATFAGITSSFSYNKRLQPINMSASSPSQTVFSIGYDFHVGNGSSGTDNGNVYGIYNFRDRTRDQTFGYDPLNRLISAQNAGTNCGASTVNGKTEYWGNTYAYDAWGNLLQKTVTKCGAENLSVIADTHNWIHSSPNDYQYDAAGNMNFDPTDGVTATYDEENRINTATRSGVITSYTYDADGNRVKKTNSTSSTLYWYMTPGIVGESDLGGAMKSEYVFFGGERVARRDLVAPTGVFYYFSDHLKTASVITDAAGNIKAESDYYPWGGELQFVNNDSNHYKFTGKERDSETGFDYFGARYYSNGLGRFISADWSAAAVPVPYADFGDPQSLNLYTYARNLPTVRIDADGHDGDKETDKTPPKPPKPPPITTADLSDPSKFQTDIANGFTMDMNYPDRNLDAAQNMMSVTGSMPGLGTPVDLLNASVSLMRGNTGDAATNAASAIPLGGASIKIAASIGKEVHAVQGAAKIARLTEHAKTLYPKLAKAADQMHHVIPKYLGGAANGLRVKLPAAYHQLITNAFRELAPYGKKFEGSVTEIVKEVYERFPLP